ncbi:MAG: ATP-binding protein [Pseudomonadota bacterium]
MMRAIWNVVMPGALAGAAAITADQIVEGEPLVAALAAAVAAVAGALLQEREDDMVSRPAQADAREPGLTPPEPQPTPPRGAQPAELPLGLGRVLLERMPLGIVLVSDRRNVIFINPAARRLFGRIAEGPVAMEALRTPRLLEAIDEVRRTREPTEFDLVLQRGGTLHMTGHAVALSAEARLPDRLDQPDVLVALEDRTRARQAEDMHRDFVANASHELKTPLAVLSGLIETLMGHARDDPAAQARFMPMMTVQTERMKRLVEDLLSLNRIELNERLRPREPQVLGRILGEVIESQRPVAEAEGCRLVCPDLEEQAWAAVRIPGVREELAQVFNNLIENAIKYGRPVPAEAAALASGAGATVAGHAGEIRVLLLSGTGARRGHVGIAVEDDGPGIAREHLPRLTERFYRVSVSRSRERGGTGLGLAIVKHVINRHRGQLEIESTLGEGSRFTVWLPVSDEAPSPAPVPLRH